MRARARFTERTGALRPPINANEINHDRDIKYLLHKGARTHRAINDVN